MSRKKFVKFIWRGENLEDVLYEIIENAFLISDYNMPFSYDIAILENAVSVATYTTNYNYPCALSFEEVKQKYNNRIGKRSSDFVRSIPNCSYKKEDLDEFDGIYTNTIWKTKYNFNFVLPDKVFNKVMHILCSLDIKDKFVFYIDCLGNISVSYYYELK